MKKWTKRLTAMGDRTTRIDAAVAVRRPAFIAAAALRLVQSGSPLFATGNLLDEIDNPPSQFRILDPHECFGEG